MNLLVSICIPTYNGEKYLQEALDSVKAQTYNNIEVIISDDNSSDATLEICNNFKAEVKFPVFIFNHIPSGIGANWNNCIKNANGEYIKFLFQDDVLMSDCIEKQLNDLLKNRCLAICSKRKIINSDSKIVNDGEWFSKYGDLQKSLTFNSDCYSFNKDSIKYNHSILYNIFGEPDTFLYSKIIFKEIGYFNEEFKQILDLEFSYRILKKYRIVIQNEYLLKFRFHEEQTSSRNGNLKLNEYKLLENFVIKSFFQNLNKETKKNIIYKKFPILKKINLIRYTITNLLSK